MSEKETQQSPKQSALISFFSLDESISTWPDKTPEGCLTLCISQIILRFSCSGFVTEAAVTQQF